MDIDTGDSPPVCQKLYTLPLKHYSWVQQEIETLGWAGVIKRASVCGPDLLLLYLRNPHQVNLPGIECILNFRKLNELQPEVHYADPETGGNISLVPLPKIDKMYGRL